MESNDTKQKILITSLKLFAENGFKATTSRMIAEKAKVNLGLVSYHFGNKEKLYLEVIKFMDAIMKEGMEIDHEAIMALLIQSEVSRDELIGVVVKILSSLLDNLLSSEYSQSIALIMSREQSSPSPGFDYIYEHIISKVQGVLVLMVAKLEGDSETKPEHYLMLNMLIGQVIVFVVSRESIFRSLGIKQYSKKHIESIRALLGENIGKILK